MNNTSFSNKIQFHKRSYIRVGYDNITRSIYRGVIILSPTEEINNSLLSVAGFTNGINYSIVNSTLTLTAISGTKNYPMYSFMLPLDAEIDESITWKKPSSVNNAIFDNEGGDSHSSGIVSTGKWNGDSVSFDITPFLNIWRGMSSSTQLGIVITNDEQDNLSHTYFHSSEAITPFIGGTPLRNVKFLTAGDTNTIATEGIRVLISQYAGYTSSVAITLVDPIKKGIAYWETFNASISTGNTFEIFSPDVEQNIILGSLVCQLIDKISYDNSQSIVVTGISLGSNTSYYTTAEFSSNSIISTEKGILEFSEPNDNLISDLSKLKNNDTIFVSYEPTSNPNNNRSYTVNFYSDELIKNNRSRLYLNEKVVSENRNELYTKIKSQGVQPKTTINILI